MTAIFEAPDGLHEVTSRGEAAGRRVEIDGKAAPQAALGRVLRLLWLTPAMDRLWTEGASGRRRFLDRIALSLFPDHAGHATAYERAMSERNRLLRDAVRDPSWYAALEREMARAGVLVDGNRRAALARLAAAVPPGDFPRAELALQSEGPRDAQDLEGWIAAGRSADAAAGRSLRGPHRDDLQAVFAAKGMPAEHCSTGEQKALLISTVLANAAAVAADFDAPPILLLDEVAAHLDADRRAALYEAVLALGAQAWMTGTGPELFSALGQRAQWLAVRDTGGVSDICPAQPV